MNTNSSSNSNGCGAGTTVEGTPTAAPTVIQRQVTGFQQPTYHGPYQGPYQPQYPQYSGSGGPYGYQGYQPQTVQSSVPRRLIPLEKHNFETRIKVINGLPKILITREAYWDMCCIVAESGSNEVGWLGTVRVEGNNYIIEKLFLPKQKVHGATCEITPEGLSDLATELLKQQDGMEIFNSIRFWGHVHPGNSTSPSGQDDDQMKVFADSCNDIFVRGILGKEGRMEFTIFLYDKNLVFLDAPWGIKEDEDELTERRKVWHDQVKANVGSFTYTQTTYVSGGQGTQTATGSGIADKVELVEDETPAAGNKVAAFQAIMKAIIYRRAGEIVKWMSGTAPGIAPFYIADDILRQRVKEPHCSREFQQEWFARSRFIYLASASDQSDPSLDKTEYHDFCELHHAIYLLEKRAYEVSNEPESTAKKVHQGEVISELINLLKGKHVPFLRYAVIHGFLAKDLVEAAGVTLAPAPTTTASQEGGSESDGE